MGSNKNFRVSFFLKKINEIIGSVKEAILYNKKQFFADEVYIHSKKISKANIYRDTALAFSAPIIEFLAILIFFSSYLILMIYSSFDLSEVTVFLVYLLLLVLNFYQHRYLFCVHYKQLSLICQHVMKFIKF